MNRGVQSFKTLLRTPGVLLGFVSSALISVAVMTPGFVPNSGLDKVAALRIFRQVLKYGLGYVLMIVGLAGLFWGWLKLRPAANHHLPHWKILLLWSLPMLLAPPIFSSDVFLYADQGWILHQGLDPYQVGLADAGGPFAANVHKIWRGTTAVYPPLALQIQHLMVTVTGFQGYLSVISMRVPAIVGVVLITIFIPRLARALGVDVELAKWFSITNPLLLIHMVGGAHNDTLMVALVLIAIYVTVRFGVPGMVVGAVLVGVGAAIKQPGFIACLAVALLPIATRLKQLTLWPRIRLMTLYCGACVLISGAVFAGVSIATGLNFGWLQATKIGELTWSMSPSSVVEQVVGPVLRLFGVHRNLLPPIALAFTIGSVLALAWLAWRYFFADLFDREPTLGNRLPGSVDDWRDRPLRWLVWGFMAVALGGAGLHVWYVLWGGIYLGMLKYSTRTFRMLIWAMIVLVTVEGGQEYYSLRTIPGYLAGLVIGYIFYVRSARLDIVGEVAPERRPVEPAH